MRRHRLEHSLCCRIGHSIAMHTQWLIHLNLSVHFASESDYDAVSDFLSTDTAKCSNIAILANAVYLFGSFWERGDVARGRAEPRGI